MNSGRANEWWLKAALMGHAEAQYRYSIALENGRGTPNDRPDMINSLKWLQAAVNQGHIVASYHLGNAYTNARPAPTPPPITITTSSMNDSSVAATRKTIREAASGSTSTTQVASVFIYGVAGLLQRSRQQALHHFRYAASVGHHRNAERSVNAILTDTKDEIDFASYSLDVSTPFDEEDDD
jgi:TPR repeat protein